MVIHSFSLKWNDRAAHLKQKAKLFHTTCNWRVAFITMGHTGKPTSITWGEGHLLLLWLLCFPCPEGIPFAPALGSHTTFGMNLHFCSSSLLVPGPPLAFPALLWVKSEKCWTETLNCKDVYNAKGKATLALWINRNFQPPGLWIKVHGLKRL